MLDVLCKGGALVTVKNTEVNGLEAWRGLKATYDSNNKGRQRVRMKYLLQPKRAESILQKTETVERWECDVRDYEQRFGKMLDEDVKIGVILALSARQVQNHCRLNSHILKSYAQVRTMLFDHWATRNVKARTKARKVKTTKMRRPKTRARKAKARTVPKLLNTLLDTVFTAKVGDT